VVEDNHLNLQIAALRRLLDHGRLEGSCIQTVARRGYRFIVPVTRVAAEAHANAAALLPSSVPPLPDKLSLAVMPFQNISGDPEQEYFADGMVEEIITALSRIRWLFVIARNSSFTYKGQAVDVKKVGREEAEIRRSSERRTSDLTAYDFYLRAVADWGSLEKHRILRALDLLGQAIERDPQYGPAIALAAHCHQRLELRGWTEDPEAARRTSVELARQALRVGPDDPNVLALVAFVLGYFGEDIDVAIGLIDHCLTLNPSFAAGWHWSGVLRIFAGQPGLAIQHFETFFRLSPRDRPAHYLNSIGEAYFFSRRFEEAAANLLESLERAPIFPVTYRVLASCYAHMGRLDDARAIIRRLRAITPTVMEPGTASRNSASCFCRACVWPPARRVRPERHSTAIPLRHRPTSLICH
jgi:pentatricopeptide repeat protein